jgi:hypothetical protein
MPNPADPTHCESCHKWHTAEDICFPLMKKHYVALEAKVELYRRMVVACEKGVRELISRPYNTKDEDKLFRAMLKVIEVTK